MEPFVLDNSNVLLEVDPVYGKIIKFENRTQDIQLVREKRLAENFRLLLPLEDWRGHFIYGDRQKLSGFHKIALHKWQLVWGPLVTERGTFDIRVEMTIELQDDTAVFNTSVHNRTEYIVEEVLAPAIGGWCNFEEENDWYLHSVQADGKGEEFPLYKTFPGSYLGPQYPVWMKNYECMPWMDIYDKSKRRGVYFGNHDTEARFSMFYSQMTPGVSQRDRSWPTREELSSGVPIGLMIGSLSFPFVRSGETYSGPSIVMHFHDGIWHTAADYYRKWYDTVIAQRKNATWLSDADAWQSTIISWPDDTINYRFSDLPRLAEEALSCGIHVLQLDGWDIGGIDRSYPHYSPDPRLGTWDELKAAIAKCQEMGVRILLFANLHWAHIETEWFRQELHQYAVQDPRGNAKNSIGWEYHTALGLNLDCETRMVMMNPRHSAFQEIILSQLDNIVQLGADGVQLDKMWSGACKFLGASIDYHPDFINERDSSIMRGVLDTVDTFLKKAREVNPEFCIASESHWDRLIPYVDASYSRFFEESHLPTFSYSFPEFRQTSCISGPADFAMVNDCIMYGLIINLEAKCIHGSAADVPDLAPYIAEALTIRKSLKDVLWDSCMVEPVMVKAGENDAVRFTVHRSRKNPGSFAAVLTNNGRQQQDIVISVEGAENVSVIQPFEGTVKRNLPCALTIPAMRFVVMTWEI